eukprot:RCo008901
MHRSLRELRPGALGAALPRLEDALKELVHVVYSDMEKSDLVELRKKLLTLEHIPALVDTFPSLAMLLGSHIAPELPPPPQRRWRLRLSLAAVLDVFADFFVRPVFFFDEMQHMDTETLQILQQLYLQNIRVTVVGAFPGGYPKANPFAKLTLLSDTATLGFASFQISGPSYRPGVMPVPAAGAGGGALLPSTLSPSTSVAEARQCPAVVTLSTPQAVLEHIVEMLMEAFYRSKDACEPLATYLWEASQGNILGIRLRLRLLFELRLLQLDTRLGTWGWDMAEV